MHEVRSHGRSPVQSEGFEAPLSIPGRVEPGEDADATLKKWDCYIKKTARAVAVSGGASGDEAEDFAQVARIALWRAIDKGAPATNTYRKRIIKNAMISAVRKERRGFGTMAFARDDFDEELVVGPDDNGAADRVPEWASALPANLKNIYELLYVQGYTQRAVARMMRVTQPRVAQLHAALKQHAREHLLDTAPSFPTLPSDSGRAA